MYKIVITVLSLILLLLVTIMSKRISEQDKTIRLMNKCLNYSDNILDNNNVWDKDGSDYMSDYLKLRQELNSTFLDGFHRK